MADKKYTNAYPYIRKYESFDMIVHQKTSPSGHAQSFWYVLAHSPDGTSLASCYNVDVQSRKVMAATDDGIAINLIGKHIRSGDDLIISLLLTNEKTITYVIEENSSYYPKSSNDMIWIDSDNPSSTVTKNTGNAYTVVSSIMVVPDDTAAMLRQYRAIAPIPTLYTTDTIVYYNASINSTPTFNIDDSKSIEDYILDADKSGAIVDYSVDWTVYIDTPSSPSSNVYVDAPPIKIVWRSKNIESALENGLLQNGNVYITVYTYLNNDINNRVDIANVNYNDAYIKTSFKDVCKFNNPSLSDRLFSALPNKLPTDDITEIYLYMSLYTDTGLYATAKLSMTYNRIYYGVILKTSTELNNSTITIILGSGNDDSGYIPPTIIDTVGDDTNSTNGYDAALGINTVYRLSNDSLQQLNSFLWTEDFFSKILSVNSAPIDNILSCKIIPYSVLGTATSIVLGNVTTDIPAQRIKSNVKITIGELLVPTYYNSFLDYAPYTKTTIYVPYIGFKELDTDSIMGKTLRIEYVIDMITGTCKALIFADNIYIISYDGQCGIDMAISAVNRGQTEASYVTGALGAIGELASGNVIGAVSTGINTALSPYHYNTQGAYSPSCGSFETKLCYLIIDRPTAQYPTTYGHDVGYPCDLSCTLSSLRGFTVCGDNIDLSGIPCTDTEREQIKDMLTSGVYL